ncbi:hypothetical protein [Desulfobacter latus]|uniref:Uncharacterized protein n=1 Tax=Desulfobacter latus TaxID=2292 RepID=A0A850T5Q6_9BACT|nr:hypothetical protein [Desulfobacter latus]NWH04652.1 hypothetical protein [Desulfobacter latus]
MWEKRFRLSLHLPVSPVLVALSHLLVGMTVYCTLALADLWGLGLGVCISCPVCEWKIYRTETLVPLADYDPDRMDLKLLQAFTH